MMDLSTAIHVSMICMIFTLAGCSIAIMIGMTRKIISMFCIPKSEKKGRNIEVKNTAKKKTTTEKKPIEKKEA
jgi:hypothetical protein